MACPAVHTGGRFLADMLIHVDCQAQAIGAYGYGALSNPTSALSIAFTGLLTIFVALFGLRLVLGEQMTGRDVMLDVLRVGIVLTLATSWPAWRVLGYNTVLQAPAAVAGSIGLASGLPGGPGELTGRLQAADDQIVVLTIYGTGRMTGGTNRSDSINDSFRGVALADQSALGYGRVAFLSGVIGPSAAVRLGAGLLLALAPLMAALLLFAGTRDMFFGWLRGLAAVAAGALVLPLIYGVELSVLEPWLRDAVAQRGTKVLTPSAPTELMVIALAFSIIAFVVLGMIVRAAFFTRLPALRLDALARPLPNFPGLSPGQPMLAGGPIEPPSRAFAVAEAVAQTMRREEQASGTGADGRSAERIDRTRLAAPQDMRGTTAPAPPELLGDSYRAARRSTRATSAGVRRDLKE